jgi:hypothetical protein
VKKILWVKFGWSEFYRGGPVDGNFPFIADGEQGHEAWNFRRQADGIYYCYTPPQSGTGTPGNPDPNGWTVICLAKKPGQTGIHIVGWYEDASLAGRYVQHPDGFDRGEGKASDGNIYSISAPTAYLVPPDARTNPFSHESVRQGKYSFLSGPNVKGSENKAEVLTILEDRLQNLRKIAIGNPDTASAPDLDNDETDPLSGFGTPEHRKEVEESAVAATTKELAKLGYKCVSREKDNVGYDLQATRSNDGDTLHLEVKGTSGTQSRFFMTSNEHDYLPAPEWRLAMVTDALGKPVVDIFTLSQFREAFDFAPLVWKGVKRKGD